ncbi:helix-turn-helix transcriptional regulator [Paenimyroides viscosum]|uniref:DNA-binding response regulator n=1 Tax=Paenimyroides viscosum TaxID=2488729 RepID=A0A3P1B3Z7_9FLAO|nr:response regulator transcription factor [Paenimyroides viscosum]RRA95432.1 DNA-binding response regulator [Paenimyroides viscosum]
MAKKLQVYMIINNPIYSEGIENLMVNKISADANIIRKENLKTLIKERELDINTSEILIYDVVKFTNKDFNYLLQLTSLNPKFKILIITSNICISDVKLLFEIGVMGVIKNNTLSDQFVEFVKKILDGTKILSKEYWDLIVEYFFHSVENANLVKDKCDNIETEMMLYDELTNREKEILGYICDGKSTREISENLFISLHTVETHRRKILTKLGVKNTASMVKVAIKTKLYAL